MNPLSHPNLSLLVLKSHQVEALVAFYTTLGLSFTEERHGDGPLHSTCRFGNLTLELYPLPEDSGPADSSTRLGFTVADLTATIRSLADLGVAVSTPRESPWGLRALVRDPDGRTVELYHTP